MTKMQNIIKQKELGVYVHWPYCARICPYCDFNVYKNRVVDHDVWINAFTAELKYWAMRTKGRKLKSLYFGGGTPSLAPLPILSAVIEGCAKMWGFEDGAEITLEVNPADIDIACYHEFSAIGINRFSLGVQSFDDQQLKLLGRDHTGEQAKTAIKAAQDQIGLVTFDLIYGLPKQSLTAWNAELEQAFALLTDHLSLYQLTIEQGTAFGLAQKRGALVMASDDELANYYELAVTRCRQAGYDHYEISNFAQKGQQAKHNLLYWQHQDYIGVGPGAHGRVTLEKETRIATQTHLKPSDYLTACEEQGHGMREQEDLSLEQQMQERFSMGLRLEEGIDVTKDDFFFVNDNLPHNRQANLTALISQGFLHYEKGRLRASEEGRRLLDGVMQALLF